MQTPRGINESGRKDIEFERKQVRKVKQCVKVPKEKTPEPMGQGGLRKSVHTQDCHFRGIIFSGFRVIWISLSERDQNKVNTPSSLFLSSVNLNVGKAFVDKDADGRRGIVWLRLIRCKQTIRLCLMKVLESVS